MLERMGSTSAERAALENVRRVTAALVSDASIAQGLERFCSELARRAGAKQAVVTATAADAAPLDGDALIVPLNFAGSEIGTLYLQPERNESFSEEDRELVEACAPMAALALHAIAAASRDPVTGVASRHVFDEALVSDWRRASRDGSWLSLIMLDLDWFKRYNDNYGHVAGDACLARIAQTAQACLKRDTDTFARYGGEEFVALVWAADAAAAHQIAERIRADVEALDIPHANSPIGHVTVSIGLAACVPAGGEPDVLKRAADRALYAAKTSGRDRVVADRLESTAGGAASYRPSNNLRAVGTSFLGRTDDAAAIAALAEIHRLVTITGPAGVGKTRLALALGQRRVYAYLDGAWFLDLAPVLDTQSIDGALAALLGIAQAGTASLRESIVGHVAAKNMLLIFDNCEHLRDAVAALVAEILARSKQISILATSREALQVEGEAAYVLPPMEADTSAALFVERGKAAFPPFSVGEHEAAVLARICERLDRLPLAIELAAPLVKTMTLDEIDQGLEHRFRLLVGSQRGVAARQRTLYAALDWSVNLLEKPARLLLENMSVFAGAANADAIRDVCAGDGVQPWEIVSALDALVEKNLVSVIDRKSDERFALLESTREFVRAALLERDAGHDVERRFVRYFTAFAKRIGEQIVKHNVEESVAAAHAERAQLQAALAAALERQLDVDSGVAMVLSLSRYWSESGRAADGAYWLERALAVTSDDSPRMRALLHDAAQLANTGGNYVRLAELGERLVALHERRADDPLGYARALHALGAAKYNLGDAEGARQMLARALEAYREVGDPRGIAIGLMNLAAALSEYGTDEERAQQLFEESLEIYRSLGLSANMGIVLANLAAIAARRGDYAKGIDYGAQSFEVFERLGNKIFASWPLVDMAGYRLELGDVDECRNGLRKAGEYLDEDSNVKYVANFCDVAFCLAVDAQRYENAARIHGYIERFRDERDVPRLPADGGAFIARLARLREILDPPQLERLAAEGRDWTFARTCETLD